MKHSTAQLIKDFGPYDGIERVHGVTYDGQQVWMAIGEKLSAIDPESGEIKRSLDIAADAGTAFDGRYLYQIAKNKIQKVDPENGQILSTIPTPNSEGDSGMAWAEGYLWVGNYRNRKIYQVDPATGKVTRTINSNRFVTGVTWMEGELWHGTWEDDVSDLRHIDQNTGEILEIIDMPEGMNVSGLESNGVDRFFCGGGGVGKVRAVRYPDKK